MDPEQTPPIDPGPDPTPDPAPDLAAELAAMRAQVAELSAKSQAAEAAAEAARIAGLSDAEKLAEERAAVAKEREGLVVERRTAALDKLGILPKFRHIAPAVDPSTTEGALALDKWAKENPELVAAKPNAPTPPPAIPPKSNLAKVLAGEVKNRFASAAFKLVGGE